MTLRNFLIIGAALGVAYGLGFVLLPGLLASVYGVELTPTVAVMDRYFGVALLAVGLMLWVAKDISDPPIVRNLLIAYGLADTVGIFVSLHATVTHVLNGMGWFNVLLYLALTAGSIFFSQQASSVRRADLI